jgi:toxin ParE1/3/4
MHAILDVSDEPERAGSYHRPEIADSVLTYHLQHSRDRVSSSMAKVSHPRHFLLYRVRPDGQVEIGRVLHESMDLDRHLLEDYRYPQSDL